MSKYKKRIILILSLIILYFAEYIYPNNFPLAILVKTTSRLFGQAIVSLPARTPIIPFIECITEIDTFRTGKCRIINLKELNCNGKVMAGIFKFKNFKINHLRGIKNGKIVDKTCPDCKPYKVLIYEIKNCKLYKNGKLIEAPIILLSNSQQKFNEFYIYWALKSQKFCKKIKKLK